MSNEGKCPTVGLNPDRLDCKKAVVLQATNPEAEAGIVKSSLAFTGTNASRWVQEPPKWTDMHCLQWFGAP